MAYNSFPYSDYHELNLDYLLNKAKVIEENVADSERSAVLAGQKAALAYQQASASAQSAQASANSAAASAQSAQASETSATQARAAAGDPKTFTAATQLTDTEKIYVYVGGTTATYTYGHFYYYSGGVWHDGGVYGTWTTDSTLSPTSTNAVQNKVLKGNFDTLDSAVDLIVKGTTTYNSYVQGYRTQADYYNVHDQRTRCTSADVYHVYAGDTVTISNIAAGTKCAILATPPNYDSGWKTADFTYTATADQIVFVECAASDHTADILPSAITTVLTIVDQASRVTENAEDISSLKSELTGYTRTYTYTGADTKYFDCELFPDQTYVITNNFNNAFAVKIKDGEGNTTTLVTLTSGASYVFTPTISYYQIGGYSSIAGSFSVSYAGFIDYTEKLFYGEYYNIVNGNITSTTNPPVLTVSNTRLRPDRFIRVRKGDTVKIVNGNLRHNFFGWYGKDPNTAVRSIVSGGFVATDAAYYFEEDGFFTVLFAKNPETNISPSEYTGNIIIGLCKYKTFRVATYNTGAFEGAGYEQGSDTLKMEYRKAIGETKANLFMMQEDLPFFNTAEQSNPQDAIFGMFRYRTRNGETNYNYKCLASDYPILKRTVVPYVTPNTNHNYFLVGECLIDGEVFTIVNLHLDWYDVTRRTNQINEVITYLAGKKRVIVGGDVNPSVRVNGEFPEGTSSTENYDHWQEDNAIWTSAGYKVANGGYFGPFWTDLTYPAPTATDCAAWDNIYVSSDICIKDAGTVVATYMNDHAIMWADLEVEIMEVC